jgi:hypothetical protein
VIIPPACFVSANVALPVATMLFASGAVLMAATASLGSASPLVTTTAAFVRAGHAKAA